LNNKDQPPKDPKTVVPINPTKLPVPNNLNLPKESKPLKSNIAAAAIYSNNSNKKKKQ